MNYLSPTWFMEGFWYPLQTPAQLILLVALAVLLGQQGITAMLRNMPLLLSVLVVGFVLNHFFEPPLKMELLLLVMALVTSLLITVRLSLPRNILLVISVLSALALGMDSKPIVIPGFGDSIMYNWLAGTWLSMALVSIALALLSYLLRNLIHGVVLRVIGSWIATSTLFVLTLIFAKQ